MFLIINYHIMEWAIQYPRGFLFLFFLFCFPYGRFQFKFQIWLQVKANSQISVSLFALLTTKAQLK